MVLARSDFVNDSSAIYSDKTHATGSAGRMAASLTPSAWSVGITTVAVVFGGTATSNVNSDAGRRHNVAIGPDGES